MPAKVKGRGSKGVDGGTSVDITAMDGLAPTVVGQSPPTNHGEEQRADTPILSRDVPNNEAHTTDGVPSVRKSLQEQGISAVGAEIILAS